MKFINALPIILLTTLLGFSSCNNKKRNSHTESPVEQKSDTLSHQNTDKSIDELLNEDFSTLTVKEIPQVWAEKRYDLLPDTYKTHITTPNGTSELLNNAQGVEQLIRGYYWSCGDNEKMNDLGQEISIEIGYNNPELTYKSGLVYFYYKYQVLKCKDLL